MNTSKIADVSRSYRSSCKGSILKFRFNYGKIQLLFQLFCMGVKLGLSYQRKSID
jgi:hypothetical protein